MVRPRRFVRALATAPLLLVASLFAGTATAQEPEPEFQAPAHIAFVDGVAILERDGEADDSPGNMPLLAGDRIRTRGGRVEILFADGSTLHLDHNSTVDLQSDALVRLIEGRLRLTIPGPTRAVGYRIDGPHGWALIDEPGEYRVALLQAPGGSELELAVLRGRAELANEGGRTPLRAGERAFVRAAAAPSYAFVVNSAAWDAFDRWAEARRDERRSASAEYLPEEVRPYAASLESHGYWRDEPTYGRVWYPRVQSDWRPYYRGRWVNLRHYGWTWVAHDPWGWPTHHYGRWGYASAGWFWIPGRTWGAAWVSWASAPGYVSWCPLGWDNRPVFQININIGRRYDPWRAWTVLPQHHFGRGYVHRNVVRIDYLDTRIRGSFRTAARAPVPLGHAVPRGGAPIRVAGTDRARRAVSPLYTNRPADQGRTSTDGARVRVPSAVDRARVPSAGGGARVPNPPVGARMRATDPRGAAAEPSRGVARERTMPSHPAVRSDETPRPDVSRGQRVQPDAPRYEPERGRSAVPRGTAREPMYGPRTDAPARRVDPPARRVESPAPRAEAPPAVRRAPHVERRAPEVGRPEAPVRRAMPRDDPRPTADQPRRAPQAERRGPERPAAGSNQRSTPERPAAASPGARPRPSGGGSTGTAVRRPGGGRTEGAQ